MHLSAHSLSPLRTAALRDELAIHGLDLDELLQSPDFHASSARRTCWTFINPRPNRHPNRVETMQQSAKRCAQQVSLSFALSFHSTHFLFSLALHAVGSMAVLEAGHKSGGDSVWPDTGHRVS